eukprot:gnl/MRDRNA2_/MRDRNA2_77144_c0_seq2.p1 gnl/MRDRNA2_/MRDRNA2_77144_c0~~gnl/MRDRNA2_/MRDRNA2_77144_c0_seq2.p1  ORF type:complete len:120 (+),score=10.98 gnl/MRDRNA2_/MRDRNA2_77144_c0_seq2:75-434(+)
MNIRSCRLQSERCMTFPIDSFGVPAGQFEKKNFVLKDSLSKPEISSRFPASHFHHNLQRHRKAFHSEVCAPSCHCTASNPHFLDHLQRHPTFCIHCIAFQNKARTIGHIACLSDVSSYI